MNRKALLFLAVLSGMSWLHAESSARSIKDVLENASRREKVMVEGKITKAFDFDYFLISDGTGEIAISFVGVKQNVFVDDKVLIYGKYDGKFSYNSRYPLIQAIEWVRPDDPKAADLRKKYPQVAAKAAPAPVSPPNPDTESRLKKLEDLKTKNLITPDEYHDQRKRILDEL